MLVSNDDFVNYTKIILKQPSMVKNILIFAFLNHKNNIISNEIATFMQKNIIFELEQKICIKNKMN